MSTKIYYYETLHFFPGLPFYHNALLQLLSLVAQKKRNNKIDRSSSHVLMRRCFYIPGSSSFKKCLIAMIVLKKANE